MFPIPPAIEDGNVAGHTVGAGRALTWTFACLILMVLAATALALWRGRGSAIREYEDREARLGMVLAEETQRAFRAADLVIAAAAEQIQGSGIATSDDLRRDMSNEGFHTELEQRLRNLPQLEALTIIDSDGQAVNTSRFWPSAGRDLSASDVFRHFRVQSDNGPYVSSPEIGRLSGEWTFFLARRIVGRDGRFVGIVSGTVSLNYFSELFDTIDRDNGQLITLLRQDGTVVISPALIGRRMAEDSRWYQVLAAGGGLYESIGFASDAPLSTSVHPLRDYPLVINVINVGTGTGNGIALGGWRRQALYIGLGSAFVI
jgi:hypothetical protein